MILHRLLTLLLSLLIAVQPVQASMPPPSLAQSVYAAAYNTWQAKVGQTANLIGGAVGYVFSGGSAANVSATASIAKSGILNNYLWHQQADMLERAKSNLQACEADGNCSPEELARYRERIAYFEGLDQYTDQQLRAECDANPSGALCKAYVADALCAAELRSTALCGGVPGFGVERWGYRSPTAMWNAQMFEHGRDYNASFGIASANLQHQQDTFDLLAEYATSVNAVRGNDSMGIALEMSVAAIGAGVLGRIPKGGLQGLAGSFGERQFQLSRADLERALTSPPIAAGRTIGFDGKFYTADGIKFSTSYYEYLYKNGRPAPFLQAREVLNSNPIVTPDPLSEAGYFRYEGAGLEMIYNPTTGQVGHIQPLR